MPFHRDLILSAISSIKMQIIEYKINLILLSMSMSIVKLKMMLMAASFST